MPLLKGEDPLEYERAFRTICVLQAREIFSDHKETASRVPGIAGIIRGVHDGTMQAVIKFLRNKGQGFSATLVEEAFPPQIDLPEDKE